MSTVMRMQPIDDAAPPDAVPVDSPVPVRALASAAAPGGAPAAPADAAPLRVTPAQRLGRTLRRELPTWALGALSIVLLIGFWHLATTHRWVFYIRFTNVPGPVEVFGGAVHLFGDKGFTTHVMLSLRRIMLGFAIATVLGVTLGLLIGRYRHVRSLLFPAMEILRPIPAIAWVPISIMLWPTTETSIVFITFIGAFFPILLNTVHGVATMDAVLVRAARCLGATEFALMTQVVLRGAMPHIFTGLAVGMGVAWVSLIAAEMISGQYGVGYFTWEAYSLIEYSNIVIGMLVIGVLGLGCSGGIRLLGRLLMPWQAGNGKENT